MSAIVNNEKPRFVYWGLNARAQMSMLMLRSANVEYIWDTDTANTWPEPKDRMPFGQLPVLYHNDLVVAQSRTIARYCAKLANIWPENLEENVTADMLMEQAEDIFTLFAKAKYSGDEDAQRSAWQEVKATKLPVKLNSLVKLLGDKNYFSGNNYHAGDIAVFSTLYLMVQAGLGDVLSQYPTLQAHYDNVMQLGSVKAFVEDGGKAYLKVPESKVVDAESELVAV
jgi:glutathione S-transferase